jgi:hypothetical protein
MTKSRTKAKHQQQNPNKKECVVLPASRGKRKKNRVEDLNFPQGSYTDMNRSNTTWVVAAAALLAVAGAPAIAQNDQDFAPAPPSIGADVPVTYFGPPPSSVQRELVGPYQELKSGKIDLDKATMTLPLYEGALKSGETVWYIVTDTDDRGNADALGLNYSSKLTFAEVGRAVRKGTLDNKFKLVFEAGRVDFAPRRSATPGDAPNVLSTKAVSTGICRRQGLFSAGQDPQRWRAHLQRAHARVQRLGGKAQSVLRWQP